MNMENVFLEADGEYFNLHKMTGVREEITIDDINQYLMQGIRDLVELMINSDSEDVYNYAQSIEVLYNLIKDNEACTD